MNTGTLYAISRGHKFAILWRDSEDAPCEPCPFCGRRHTHGKGDGHRVPHCSDENGHSLMFGEERTVTAYDGTVLRQRDGYIVQPRQADAK
jgi:hypothetical protein